MHEVDGGVVADLVGGAVPQVEAVEEPLVDVLQRNVVRMDFTLEEFLHPVLANLVADECLLAVTVVPDDDCVLFDELSKSFIVLLIGFSSVEQSLFLSLRAETVSPVDCMS